MNKGIGEVIKLEKLEAELEKIKLKVIKEKYVIKEQMWYVSICFFVFKNSKDSNVHNKGHE